MDDQLRSLDEVLDDTDALVRSGRPVGPPAVPTGFSPLDDCLGGGLRAGDLTVLGGPQGLGKTTFVLQLARNVADAGGRVFYFGFEHDRTTVLARILAMEAGLLRGGDAFTLSQVRQALESDVPSEAGLSARLEAWGADELVLRAIRAYAPRLVLHRSDGRHTSAEQIRQIVLQAGHDETPPLVIVDYLQKVPVPGGPPTEDERMTVVIEALKDLALESGAPVLAVAAADKEGLLAGGRLRLANLRGSSALAYEPDVALMLQDKQQIVARHHLVYGSGTADRFLAWAVLSIEKNRGGRDRVDMEFEKRFASSMFDPRGRLVAEQLLDDRIFTE